MSLAERLVAIHRALEAGRVPHAFGGAIALAYSTQNPRGTSDLDINIFVSADECEAALKSLPREVAWGAADVEAIKSDGQRRLWWEKTPVDVFFDYDEIHADAARNRRWVEFAGTEIPILAPTELAIFKAVFDRTRDWADLEEMADAGSLDVEEVRKGVERMVGPDDPRIDRLAQAAARGTDASS